ncbi:MAG: DUF2809 domain-containing protein [Phycisphaeraceae bacterium]|nr:DUF2809 domain-containing protein [Phycisphaeraceae bacterium]
MQSRVLPASIWCAVIALGLLIRAVLAGAPAKYLGVALWAMSVYFLLLVISPRMRPVHALVWCLVISWGVELAQITGIPRRFSSMHPLLRLVFGEVYNPADLVALAAGSAAGWAVWVALGRIRARKSGESAGLETPR